MNNYSISDDPKRRKAISRGGSSDLQIFIRDVRDVNSRKVPLTVRTWSTIKDVKDQIQKATNIPSHQQRLYFGPLMNNQSTNLGRKFNGAGKELPNYRTLADAGVYRSGQILTLDVNLVNSSYSMSMLHESAPNDLCVAASMLDCCPREMKRLVLLARQGLATGLKPELGLDGSGGTYFLRDARKSKVAVFKPADEEPYAVNNPRGYLRSGNDELCLREGIHPGEACLREVAAFLLDHDGFSGVPLTTLALARHPAFNVNGSHLRVNEGGASLGPHSLFAGMATTMLDAPSNNVDKTPLSKIGSCQEFVNSETTMDDLSFSKISVQEVHKIAVLDIRLMNADRNAGNLLVRRKPDNSLELVPIDHGFCLRTECDVAWFDWCWLEWPQLKQPVSESTRKYILELDVDADCQVLEERLHLSAEALDIFKASSMLLQEGIKADLSLYDIAMLCHRSDDTGDVASRLEIMMSMANELASTALKNDRWGHDIASRALEEQLYTPPALSGKGNKMKKCTSMSLLALTSSAQKSIPEYDDSPIDAPFDFKDFSVHTSGSDSSVVSEEDDMFLDGAKDNVTSDADTWAAEVIRNMNVDRAVDTLRLKVDELSLKSSSDSNSDDISLSSSPKGFWHVSPESALNRQMSLDDDHANVRWSPSTSPRMGAYLSTSPAPVFRLLSPDESRLVVPVKPMKNTMTRAKSYSAFSYVDPKNKLIPDSFYTPGPSKEIPRDDPRYRKYFMKFVELLISKETMSSSKQKIYQDSEIQPREQELETCFEFHD